MFINFRKLFDRWETEKQSYIKTVSYKKGVNVRLIDLRISEWEEILNLLDADLGSELGIVDRQRNKTQIWVPYTFYDS